MGPTTDPTMLLRQALDGDEGAYRRFLLHTADAVRKMVRRRLFSGCSSDVEDVVQEILLAIHAKRHTWRADGPVEPWVAAIARYKIADAARRRGREAALDIDDYEELLAAPEPETASERDIAGALGALPPGQRSVVSAIGLEGRSISETAARFGMSEVAVRVSLSRGLSAIRARAGMPA